jgi:C4-dicarboxylate-specific signal transduction histidine kinase
VRLLAPQKAMRDVALAQRVDGPLPPVALANDRLVQVLLNLVLNAADAARGRKDARVELRASRAGDGVVLDVEDNGPGIPPALRARVFEPFYTTKPAGEGTGLGLAICAVLVEQAGGRIEALERVGGGSGARVRVSLPAAPP